MHEIDNTKLSDQTRYRLYEIKKIENYFINEITAGIIKRLLITTIKKKKARSNTYAG